MKKILLFRFTVERFLNNFLKFISIGIGWNIWSRKSPVVLKWHILKRFGEGVMFLARTARGIIIYAY